MPHSIQSMKTKKIGSRRKNRSQRHKRSSRKKGSRLYRANKWDMLLDVANNEFDLSDVAAADKKLNMLADAAAVDNNFNMLADVAAADNNLNMLADAASRINYNVRKWKGQYNNLITNMHVQRVLAPNYLELLTKMFNMMVKEPQEILNAERIESLNEIMYLAASACMYDRGINKRNACLHFIALYAQAKNTLEPRGILLNTRNKFYMYYTSWGHHSNAWPVVNDQAPPPF